MNYLCNGLYSMERLFIVCHGSSQYDSSLQCIATHILIWKRHSKPNKHFVFVFKNIVYGVENMSIQKNPERFGEGFVRTDGPYLSICLIISCFRSANRVVSSWKILIVRSLLWARWLADFSISSSYDLIAATNRSKRSFIDFSSCFRET